MNYYTVHGLRWVGETQKFYAPNSDAAAQMAAAGYHGDVGQFVVLVRKTNGEVALARYYSLHNGATKRLGG